MKALILDFNHFGSLTIEQKNKIKSDNNIDQLVTDFHLQLDNIQILKLKLKGFGYSMKTLILDENIEEMNLSYIFVELDSLSSISYLLFPQTTPMCIDVGCSFELEMKRDFDLNYDLLDNKKDIKIPPNGRSQGQHNRIMALNKRKRY